MLRIKRCLQVASWLLIGLAVAGCTNTFFQPMKQHIASPEQYGIQYQDVYFGEDKGPRLHGWWFPAQQEARASVLFLHGNAENISTHSGMAYWLTQYGYNVFIFDYRGYGYSEGEVDVGGAIKDIQTAKNYVKRAYASQQALFVVSHSLGASLGVVSLSEDAEGLDGAIFVSPFSEYPQVAREMMSKTWLGWVLQWPLSLTISHRYDPVDYVADLKGLPVVFMYSAQDEVIAPVHVSKLYARAEGDRHLEQLVGSHNRLFSIAENQQAILGFLDRWSGR